jgi:hypothetical protein
MGMGLFLPRGVLDFLVRPLHKNMIPTVAKRMRTRALRTMMPIIAGKKVPSLFKVSTASLDKVTVSAAGDEAVLFAAL